MLHLYLISQDTNTGYDTYDSAVVATVDEETARKFHPRMMSKMDWGKYYAGHSFYQSYDSFVEHVWKDDYSGWVRDPSLVKVKHLGIADDDIEEGIVCVSFNAG